MCPSCGDVSLTEDDRMVQIASAILTAQFELTCADSRKAFDVLALAYQLTGVAFDRVFWKLQPVFAAPAPEIATNQPISGGPVS